MPNPPSRTGRPVILPTAWWFTRRAHDSAAAILLIRKEPVLEKSCIIFAARLGCAVVSMGTVGDTAFYFFVLYQSDQLPPSSCQLIARKEPVALLTFGTS